MPVKNLIHLADIFKDDESCRKYLERVRWNGKPECPFCESKKIRKYKDFKRYKCVSCGQNFTVTVRTPFERTKIPLRKWFFAMYLIAENKKGISSHELARTLGITQKTAWHLLHRIREMLKAKNILLDGIVEVDETYVGGKYKNKHKDKKVPGQQGRGGTEKIPVFGIKQRGGKVISQKVNDVSGRTLKKIIKDKVALNSVIMSDEWKAYRGLNKSYTHQKVDHGRRQYVNGDAHTNSVENYWSHVKRTIIGTYHFVSRQHIDRYCVEFDFRHNHRNNSNAGRFMLMLMNMDGKTLPLKTLRKQA